MALVFVALGVWQVRRLEWKVRLIAATQAAVHAAPIAAAALPPGNLVALAYRPVALHGHYRAAATTLVTGTSVLGTGYWEMVPLVDDRGGAIFVNRGFLPQGSRVAAARAGVPAGPVIATGLLRLTEPGGTWLRANHPRDDRWYSRDIAMIAATRAIAADPRLFIDAWVENPPPGSLPPGALVPTMGLTVLDFPNSHLGYALTWFALAGMAVAGMVVLVRRR